MHIQCGVLFCYFVTIQISYFAAYPSLKTLGSWARDLKARVDHFAVWAQTLKPPLFFWLAAYTFPTGFLTAVLQVITYCLF